MLNIRIEEETKKELEQYCAANNITISDLLRDLINVELRKGHRISQTFERIEGHTDVGQQHPTLDRGFLALPRMMLLLMEEEGITQQLIISLCRGTIEQKWAGKSMPQEARDALEKLEQLFKQNEEGMTENRRILEEIKKALGEGDKTQEGS